MRTEGFWSLKRLLEIEDRGTHLKCDVKVTMNSLTRKYGGSYTEITLTLQSNLTLRYRFLVLLSLNRGWEIYIQDFWKEIDSYSDFVFHFSLLWILFFSAKLKKELHMDCTSHQVFFFCLFFCSDPHVLISHAHVAQAWKRNTWCVLPCDVFPLLEHLLICIMSPHVPWHF